MSLPSTFGSILNIFLPIICLCNEEDQKMLLMLFIFIMKYTIMSSEIYPKIYLYRRIVQAKLFIDNNYSENIDLDNIADEAYFSKFHFIRLFAKIYGKTPHQYLRTVRIENAMLLLRANVPVSEVCYAVGFESLSSFSNLFKRMVGLSPSDYLLQQQQIKAQILNTPLQFIPGCFAEKKGWFKKTLPDKNSNFEQMRS